MKRILWIAGRLIDTQARREKRIRAYARHRTAFVHTAARGLKFRLEPDELVDRYIYIDGIYEKRFLHFVRKLFKGKRVALDVGANIGNHTIYLADAFETIHSFEPNPSAFHRLNDNIALNRLTNVQVHPFGLSDRDAALPFQSGPTDNLGAGGFVRDGRSSDDGVTLLTVRRGDDVIDDLKLDRIDFIKIDVEGHEPAVFAGLARAITRYRPVIAFEFHGQDAAPGDWRRIADHLPGYVLVEAEHAPPAASLWAKLRWNYRHAGWPMLRRFVEPEPRTYENIVAFPSEEMLAWAEREPR